MKLIMILMFTNDQGVVGVGVIILDPGGKKN